jgi:hypothetical protein
MTIEYLGLRSHLTGYRNTVNLMVRGDFSLLEKCKIVIERPGQNRPYLAENGWQSNYSKSLIDVLSSGESEFELCLPLGFAQYLDSEHNYKVELFDLDDDSVGIFGMNWTPPPRVKALRVEPVTLATVDVVENLPEHEPEPLVQEPEIALSEPPRRRVVNRKVRNCVRCGGQIFSTFIACPYCGSAIT